MAKAKFYELNKILLGIAKKAPKAVLELISIRGNGALIKEDFDAYKDADQTLKLMKKKKATFFISSIDGKTLSLGRSYDGQFLELFNFSVRRMLASSDISGVPAELHVKCAVILQGISNSRMENMMLDLFHQRSHEVDLSAVRYAWVVEQKEKIFTIRYVRIMKDHSVEDVGPIFQLELEKEFYAGDDVWTKALDIKKVRKNKSVEKNAFKDTVGKLHIDRQDLKEITLKKSKGYKRKTEETVGQSQ